MLNVQEITILLLTMSISIFGINSAIAQPDVNRSISSAPPAGSMAPKAVAALSKVSVHGVKLRMSIGEARSILKEQGYVIGSEANMSRGATLARFIGVKGKVKNNGQDRERFELLVIMDEYYNPRKPAPYNPDWPIVKIEYLLQDTDNRANIKGHSGYDWTGTAERKISEQVRDLVCSPLVSYGLACKENGAGFSTGSLQDGTRGGAIAIVLERMSGVYKINLTSEKLY